MRGRSLDFFVVFSSMAAIEAPFAEVDYAAANAFLDAFAWFASAQSRLPDTSDQLAGMAASGNADTAGDFTRA